MSTQIRPASKAGSWYSADSHELRQEIQSYLDSCPSISEHVIGGLVPHAGLAFSGPTAALTCKALQESCPDAKTILLLGAVHTMFLDTPAVWPDGVWQCPCGDMEVDADACANVISKTCAENCPQPHIGDNALELQLPFLSICFKQAKIVPIAVPCNDSAVTLGEELAGLYKDSILAGETVFIASSDLTHYGEAYGFAPVGMGKECLQWAEGNDKKLLDLASGLQEDKIVPQVGKDHSACGGGAIAAACALAKGCGSPGGKLLEHTNSHEIMPRPVIDLFVGYASMVFLKP